MAPSIHDTPVGANNCKVPDCKKQQAGGYKSKNGLTNHMKRWHQAAKDVLSPMAETARALFQTEEELQPSTQGNSSGAVNSPKVVSEARLQCGACDKEFGSTAEMSEHMTMHYNSVAPEQNDDILEDEYDEDEPNNDKEYVSDNDTTENETVVDQYEGHLELNNMMTVDKIVDSFIDNAFRKMHPNEVTTDHDDVDKDLIISDLKKVVDEKDIKLVEKTALATGLHMKIKQMTTELETLKHDAAMRQEVDDDQRKELEDAKENMDKLRKDLQTQKARNKDVLINEKLKKRENNKIKLEMKSIVKDLDVLRENNGQLNKDNSDLKIHISVKDGIIKGLREALGDDEVVVVNMPDADVMMNRETTFHKCNACNKDFKKDTDLEKHIRAKHTEVKCTYCDNVCDNESKLIEHHKECVHIGVANNKCEKCDKLFTFQGLKRHKPSCHNAKKYYECDDCGMILSSPRTLKEHHDSDHPMETVKSREVCYHWRRGNCFKGDSCRFAHVGRQNQNGSSNANTNRTNTKVPACSNGSACEWLSKGICSYFHPRVGVQKPWVKKKNQQGGRQEDRGRQGGLREGAEGVSGRREDRGPAGRQGGPRAGSGGQADRQDRSQGGRQGDPRAGSGARGGRQDDRSRPIIQPDRLPCKFDGRCERIPNCPYIHSLEDFPLLQRRGIPVRRGNLNQRRN